MEGKILTIGDYTLIAAYLLSLLVIGFRASRKRGADNFLIADRELGLLSAVATINASKTGSIIIIFTAFIYAYGMSAIWYFVGMSIGYLLYLPFALKLYRKSEGNYYTLADYYHHNYGERAAKFASLACIIAMFGSMMLNLIAATKVFVFFSGFSYWLAAWLVAGVVLVYLLFAGFKAVVSTDIFQYCVIIAILLLFFTMLFGDVAIPASEYSLSQAGKKNLVGFFLLGILLPFAQPELWQRIYAIKDENLLKKSIFISIVIHFAMAIVLALVGLSIKTMLPDIQPDMALIEGFSRLLPSGLVGLAVIVFFSAMMSSIDTYAYTASSCIVQDFFKKDSGADAVKLIRRCLVAIVIPGTIITIFYNNLVGAAFVLSGFLITVSIPTLLTWARPSIGKEILDVSIPISIILLMIVVGYELFAGGLNPTLVLKAIGVSLLSLLIAYVLNFFGARQAASVY